jgi:hypothetical protein
MATLNSHAVINHAVNMVTAALQSGTIKLQGPASGNYNIANIKEDSAYLNGIIDNLIENLSKK